MSTFFPDILNVPSIEPSKPQDVKLKFGYPYSIATCLNSDSRTAIFY